MNKMGSQEHFNGKNAFKMPLFTAIRGTENITKILKNDFKLVESSWTPNLKSLFGA